MTTKQIQEALRKHGFSSGRLIAMSKSGYCKRFPKNFVIFNAKILTRRSLILTSVDLDLTLDAKKLTAAARTVDEDFYVLREHCPSPFWEPGAASVSEVLPSAVWRTRIRSGDQDVFTPFNSAHRQQKGIQLGCTIGTWQGEPAYWLDLWNNSELRRSNMAGAALVVRGNPPKGFSVANRDDVFTTEPSIGRGRPVRPVICHRRGELEYVWFSHGVAVPALLLNECIRLLNPVTFTSHRDSEAIHIRKVGKVIGLLWPCTISDPELIETGRAELRKHRKP